MKCPKCHFDNPDDTNLCGKCAAPLPAACGPISTEWKIDGGAFALSLSIPPNTTAIVVIPAKDA